MRNRINDFQLNIRLTVFFFLFFFYVIFRNFRTIIYFIAIYSVLKVAQSVMKIAQNVISARLNRCGKNRR